MSRLIFLEWDDSQLRILDTRISGPAATLLALHTIELPDGGMESPTTLLAAQITAANVGKSDAVVLVGRTGCQLRTLNVPKVPAEELPEIVRFQAMRQLSNINQDSAIDFVVISESDEHGIEVLVAVLSPQLLKQIQQTVGRAGLDLHRILLRPFATATLVSRNADADEIQLLVDQTQREADLILLKGRSPLTTRTIRLAANDKDYAKLLVGEIRRTLAAANNQGFAVDLKRLTLTGSPSEMRESAAHVSAELKVPVDVLDPFSLPTFSNNLRTPPEQPGHYAALLGAVQQELIPQAERVDFVNPRKRTEDHSGKQRAIFYGSLAAIVLLVLVVLAYIPIHLNGNQIKQLQQEIQASQEFDAKNKEIVSEIAVLDSWVKDEVIWLDEIYYTSYQLPPAERTMITFMNLSANANSKTPQISITGLVKGSETVGELESGLRDESHQASGKKIIPLNDRKDKLYDFEFDQTVSINERQHRSRFDKKPSLPVEAAALNEADSKSVPTKVSVKSDP
jgi:Tfp pilus assembly PilM family ATPase